MQSRQFLLGAAVLLCQAALPAAPAFGQQTVSTSDVALTLGQAIELALSSNPGLRSATRAIGIADGALLQAGARPNPELSFLSEGTDRRTRTETTQLSQVIELGGKRAARIGAAEQERAGARAEVDVRRAQLRADVIAAYMDALTAQERLALARASLALARRSTEVTSRRVLAGKISPVEQTRSSVAEAGAGLELAQAEAELALAGRRLSALWGSPQPLARRLQAPDGFERLPAWADLERSLAGAPQLRRAQAAVAGRDAQLGLERAQRLPDLTLILGAQREREAGRTQAVAGVSLPLPLFNRNQGNILSAVRRADQARDDFEAERLRLTQALADAYQRAEVAALQAQTLREQVLPAAQGAYDAAMTGFGLGKFPFADVLDAQRTLFQAKSQYLRALAERYRALADIERYVVTERSTG